MAEQEATDQRTEDRVQSVEEQRPNVRLELSAAESAPLLSTVNFTEPINLIGLESLKSQLTQWLQSDLPLMILHGHSGSGLVRVALNMIFLLNETQKNIGSFGVCSSATRPIFCLLVLSRKLD